MALNARFALSDVAHELERIVEERLEPAILAACKLEADLASARAAHAITEESLHEAFTLQGSAEILLEALRHEGPEQVAAAHPQLRLLKAELQRALADAGTLVAQPENGPSE